jgi:hypothetical protein
MRSGITIHRAICDSAGAWGAEERNIKTVNDYSAAALHTELDACSSPTPDVSYIETPRYARLGWWHRPTKHSAARIIWLQLPARCYPWRSKDD